MPKPEVVEAKRLLTFLKRQIDLEDASRTIAGDKDLLKQLSNLYEKVKNDEKGTKEEKDDTTSKRKGRRKNDYPTFVLEMGAYMDDKYIQRHNAGPLSLIPPNAVENIDNIEEGVELIRSRSQCFFAQRQLYMVSLYNWAWQYIVVQNYWLESRGVSVELCREDCKWNKSFFDFLSTQKNKKGECIMAFGSNELRFDAEFVKAGLSAFRLIYFDEMKRLLFTHHSPTALKRWLWKFEKEELQMDSDDPGAGALSKREMLRSLPDGVVDPTFVLDSHRSDSVRFSLEDGELMEMEATTPSIDEDSMECDDEPPEESHPGWIIPTLPRIFAKCRPALMKAAKTDEGVTVELVNELKTTVLKGMSTAQHDKFHDWYDGDYLDANEHIEKNR